MVGRQVLVASTMDPFSCNDEVPDADGDPDIDTDDAEILVDDDEVDRDEIEC